jgi:hypothetical protein
MIEFKAYKIRMTIINGHIIKYIMIVKVFILTKIKINIIIWILCLNFNKKNYPYLIKMIYLINNKLWESK